MDINSIEFTPEEVKKGMVNDLINYILLFNSKATDGSHISVMIETDGYCTSVKFIQQYKDEVYRGVWLNEDQQVYSSLYLPDGSCIDVIDDDQERNAVLKDWLKEHPGWEQNQYGHWFNTKEQYGE